MTLSAEVVHTIITGYWIPIHIVTNWTLIVIQVHILHLDHVYLISNHLSVDEQILLLIFHFLLLSLLISYMGSTCNVC